MVAHARKNPVRLTTLNWTADCSGEGSDTREVRGR